MGTFFKRTKNPRVKINVKEYFLRLRFFTYINKNTEILKNFEINKNGETKVTLNREEINELIICKYKDLLGDEGIKNNYSEINDKIINISIDYVKYAYKNIIKKKACSWDLISGKSLKLAIKEGDISF